MASLVTIIPLLCTALRGTCPAANKQQGHSSHWKAEIIPKATPLLRLSSPAGSTGSCGAVPLTSEAMGMGPWAAMQCLMHKPTTSQQPANRPLRVLRDLSTEKHPPFSFPSTVFLNQHTTGNIMVPCQTTEKHQNLSISAFTGDRKRLHRHRSEARRSLGNLLHSNRSEILQGMEKVLFVLTSVQESIACNSACSHAGLGSKSRTSDFWPQHKEVAGNPPVSTATLAVQTNTH